MKLCDLRLLRRELAEFQRLEAEWRGSTSLMSRRLEKHLHRRREELAAVLWELSKFIAEIGDPELRLIFELRYLRGLDWGAIAEELPTKMTPDSVRMKHNRHLAHHGGRICQQIVGP